MHTETPGPQGLEPQEQPCRILKEGPSLPGWWTIDSKNEFGAEKPTQGPPEPPKPSHGKLQPGGGSGSELEGDGTSRQMRVSHKNKSLPAAGVWAPRQPSWEPLDLHSAWLKPQ